MPVGFEVRNSAGELMFSGTDRLVRFIGFVEVNGAGSVTDARFATGTPFYVWIGDESPDVWWRPTITFSGTTLSWSFPGIPVGLLPAEGTLYYGVY